MSRGCIDWQLSDLVDRQGGFSTQLSFADRQRLRAIVKKVHLRYFPTELVSNYMADKLIDVVAPETAAYLIRHHMEKGT